MGQETAISFAREGAKVIAADIDEEGVKQRISSIKAIGGEAVLVVFFLLSFLLKETAPVKVSRDI
ncbi:hypothetical protein J7E63_13600 [Bacillus sp. ISL-75]|nr:hypothetical protein [Bacillus sp. ISL-75]